MDNSTFHTHGGQATGTPVVNIALYSAAVVGSLSEADRCALIQQRKAGRRGEMGSTCSDVLNALARCRCAFPAWERGYFPTSVSTPDPTGGNGQAIATTVMPTSGSGPANPSREAASSGSPFAALPAPAGYPIQPVGSAEGHGAPPTASQPPQSSLEAARALLLGMAMGFQRRQ